MNAAMLCVHKGKLFTFDDVYLPCVVVVDNRDGPLMATLDISAVLHCVHSIAL